MISRWLIVVILGMILFSATASGATIRGQDGRWYGNICLTQAGAYYVQWLPVGSICYSPSVGIYGFILNQ